MEEEDKKEEIDRELEEEAPAQPEIEIAVPEEKDKSEEKVEKNETSQQSLEKPETPKSKKGEDDLAMEDNMFDVQSPKINN